MSAQRPHYRGAWHPDYLASHGGSLRAADAGSHIETQAEADRLNATVTVRLCGQCGGDGVQAGIGFRCTFCEGTGLSDAWVDRAGRIDGATP